MKKASISRRLIAFCTSLVFCLVTVLGTSPLCAQQSDEDGPSRTAEHLANFHAPTSKLGSGNPVNIKITQIDISQFPYIKTTVSVFDDEGKGIEGLDKGNFALTEEGIDESIDVTPVSGVSSNINVALVFDRSGSMGYSIEDAKTAAKTFVDNFENLDRSALVSFASYVQINLPFTFMDTDGKNTIKSKIDSLLADGLTALVDGCLEAVNMAAAEVGVKTVVVFTDGVENNSSHDLQDLVDAAVAANVPIYTIGLGSSVDEAFLIEIADNTGGSYYYAPTSSDMAAIYNEIKAKIQAQYVLAYITHDPLEDGTTRTVEATVTYNTNTDSGSKTYVAQLPPQILLTQGTIDLSYYTQQDNVALPIKANIMGSNPIAEASLWYRKTGSGTSYSQISMNKQGTGTLYDAEIPAYKVDAPGVDYYITASDGTLTASEPPLNPEHNPHQIPVVPNNAPFITHVPVTLAEWETDITITSNVHDDSDYVAVVKLFYRKAGQPFFESVEMTYVSGSYIDGVYQGAIPGFVHTEVDPPGCDYYIEATDNNGFTSTHGTQDNPHRVNYQPDRLLLAAYWCEDCGSGSTARLSLRAWAYDPNNGMRVITGVGKYTVYDESGNVVLRGNLKYLETSKFWTSYSQPFDYTGIFVYEANINGMVGRMTFGTGKQKCHITGEIVDRDGNAVSGANVNLLKQVITASGLEWWPVAGTTSQADGSYDFGERNAHTYWVKAEKGTLKGQDGPFYAIGLLAKKITITDFSVPVEAIDNMKIKLLNLMDRHVEQIHEASRDVDGIVSGEDLQNKIGVDVLSFVALTYNLWKSYKLIFEKWPEACKMVDYFNQAKAAGNFDAVLWKSGTANVLKAEMLKESSAAFGDTYAFVLEEFAEGIVDPITEKNALVKWGARITTKEGGMRKALSLLLPYCFTEEVRDFYKDAVEDDLEILLDSIMFLVPEDLQFKAKLHYLEKEQIKQYCKVYSEVEYLLNEICDSYKQDLVGINVNAQTDMARLRDIFSSCEGQVDMAKEHSGSSFVSYYGETLPINLNDPIALYNEGVEHVRAVWFAQTAKIIIDVGVGVSSIGTGGLSYAAYLAVSAGVGLGLETLEQQERLQVMGYYELLAHDWALATFLMPAVLERTYTYAVVELIQPKYAVSDADEKFKVKIENIDIHPDYVSPLSGRKVIWFEGLLIFNNSRGLDFTVNYTGSENGAVRVIKENQKARLFSPDYMTTDAEIWPHSKADPDHPYTAMGVELSPGETINVSTTYIGQYDIANIFKPNRVVLRAFVGPKECEDIYIEPYWVLRITDPYGWLLSLKETVGDIEAEKAVMRKVNLAGSMGNKRLTLYDALNLAQRVQSLGSANLSLSNPSLEESYTASSDAHSLKILMYSPIGSNIDLHVYEGDKHVGWSDDFGASECSFIADYSGRTANPEVVLIPEAAGRTFLIEARLVAANSEMVFPVKVEIEEEPVRPGSVLALQRDSIEKDISLDMDFTLMASVAEASGQQPLTDVTATISDLVTDDGKALTLLSSETPATYSDPIIPAGGRRDYEWRFNAPEDSNGEYKGTITYTSNAGTLEQDVVVTVAIAPHIVNLAIMKDQAGDHNLYLYNSPAKGCWTYEDALGGNPEVTGRDLWIIPAGNSMQLMTGVNTDDDHSQELAILKVDRGVDQNLYLYNMPLEGDWTYWDCFARNPSPLARDLWVIPARNDIVFIADAGDYLAVMKDNRGDYNLYLYNVPRSGDWTFWDAFARNPSPVARDLWIIPYANDAVAMCGLDTTGDSDSDSLLVVREGSDGGQRLYIWNMPVPGDWTYRDSVGRNLVPLAVDGWAIPQRGGMKFVTGMSSGRKHDDLCVMENNDGDYNIYTWIAPQSGDLTMDEALARNPSARARDLWLIPAGNNVVGMSAIRTE